MKGLEHNSDPFDMWFDEEHSGEEDVDEVSHDNHDDPFDAI